jgi:hypothetical protein
VDSKVISEGCCVYTMLHLTVGELIRGSVSVHKDYSSPLSYILDEGDLKNARAIGK